MTRHITALFLALIMMLGILSMPVMAANDGGWLEDADITEEDFYTEPEEELDEEPEEEPEEKKKPSKKDKEPSIVFTDVPTNAWYYDVVMDLVEAKILGGFGDGTFRPANTVTTGQALKMILLASGFEEPAPVESHWARCFLNLALDAGILQRGEITDLDINITRAMVAKIAAISLGVTREDDEQVFTDTNDDHIMALYEIGILGGYDDNTFRPTKALTRAELSAIAHRIYAYVDGYEEKDDDEDEEKLEGAPELRTSEEALDYIMSVEGFCEEPYWDYQQYSIGYGSRCDPDDYPDGITKKEAELLLREMISDFEAELDKFLKKNKIKLKDHEYDALVSFTYNIGTDWMRSSRLANLLIEDDYSENDFASAFGIWCHVGSSNPQVNSHLVARRIRELQMFLDNDYTGEESDGFVCLYFETDRGEVEVDIAFYREGTEYDPLFSAECEDDEFIGWMTEDGEFLEESDRPRKDMTVYAVWESDNW